MPIYPESIGRRSRLGTSEELSKAVRRFQEGEREVFNDIYKMSYGYLHTCVSRALDNENAVQDMLQETYLEIYRSIGQLRQPESFLHWAAAIAGRKCIAWVNREKRLPVEGTGHAEEYLEEVAESEEFLPETILQNKEKQDLLRKMIDRLPPMQKICIVAYYYHELSQQEIAEELGVPLNTVKSYLNRARKKIRAEVLELEEQKDIKLYTMAPFFLLLLDMEAEACEISAMPEKLARMAGAHIAAGKAKAAGIHIAAGKLAAIVTAAALTAGGAALVLTHPWTGSVMTYTEGNAERHQNTLTASEESEIEEAMEKRRETLEKVTKSFYEEGTQVNKFLMGLCTAVSEGLQKALESKESKEREIPEGLDKLYKDIDFGFELYITGHDDSPVVGNGLFYEEPHASCEMIAITKYAGDVGDHEQKERIDMSRYKDSTDIFDLLIANISEEYFYGGLDVYDMPAIETKVINGYEMTKFEGTVTFYADGYEGGEVCPAVAYGIKAKSTPVLVCCVDRSDNKDRHAYWVNKIDDVVSTFKEND